MTTLERSNCVMYLSFGENVTSALMPDNALDVARAVAYFRMFDKIELVVIVRDGDDVGDVCWEWCRPS